MTGPSTREGGGDRRPTISSVTEVNGLRLAYKGFVGGLAGAYVWTAIAMALAGLVHGDPLRPLAPFALALTPLAGSPELSFVLGLLAVQAGGAFVGMGFAYFFGRYFTIRATMAAAAPIAALLAWGLIAVSLRKEMPGIELVAAPISMIATLGYGLVLGATVPLRGEVTRYSGSPST
jgi:hypothetical protein